LIDRYYDPSTGQFLSVDPKVATTGQAYAYTGDDPVNGKDPSGDDYVYLIASKNGGVPFYVGRSNDPTLREAQHQAGENPRYNPAKDTFEVLQTNNLSVWQARSLENYEIRDLGTNLGNGGYPYNQRNEIAVTNARYFSSILLARDILRQNQAAAIQSFSYAWAVYRAPLGSPQIFQQKRQSASFDPLGVYNNYPGSPPSVPVSTADQNG
jgi:hypothetical protein